MNSFIQDVSYGLRMLMRSPGMTVAAVLTLALGIGANTAVYTGVHQALVNPVPGLAPSREFVEVGITDADHGMVDMSSPDYRDYRAGQEVLEDLIAFGFFPMNITDSELHQRIWPILVSGNYFDVLGVRAAHGRTFVPNDDAGAGQPVVVISHGLWQRNFGGRPDTIGKTIALNGHRLTIVGIAPPDFYGTLAGVAFDAWLPLALQDQVSGWRRSEGRDLRWLWTIGWLKPGVTRARAEERLNLIAQQLARQYPESHSKLRVTLYPLGGSPRGPAAFLGQPLLIVMGLMALLLLIACANVANLLLSRAATRQREIAIRIAVGAGRGRLMQQLLTESMLLAILGGIAGVPIGMWTLYSLNGLLPPLEVPMNLERGMDAGVFVFAAALTGLSGVIFGFLPAFQTTRADVVTTLKDEAAGATGGRRRSLLRHALVVAQISFSLVLLVAAVLMMRSLQHAQTAETGFSRENVLLASLNLLPQNFDAARGRLFYQQVIQRMTTVPGITAATVARRIPLGLTSRPWSEMVVEGYAPQAGERPWSYSNTVGPDFFRMLQIPFLAGRDFTFQDTDHTQRVAVINQTVANTYWRDRQPLGQRVRFDGTWYTIIGVVRDFQMFRLDEPPTPYVFLPMMQDGYNPTLTLMVRTSGPPAAISPAVHQAMRELNENVSLFGVRTLERHVEWASFPQRMAAALLSAFGMLALGMAAVGIYGVMAYSVAQRVREMGIRMALGAQPRDILRLILGQGVWLTLIGIAIGMAGAWGVSRLLARVLLGLPPGDPVSFASMTLLLAAVALLACYIPARRAMRVDPVVALRHE